MAECFLVQNGGGNPLNFRVVGNPQPTIAKENTIWVDTDIINNYYFSATQPENMVDYDVWFLLDKFRFTEFNALKKNGIQVYPLSAKQYAGGVLEDVEAKIYQNGEWNSFWDGEIYKEGNEYLNLTGGWTSGGWVGSNNATVVPGILESDRIVVRGGEGNEGIIATTNKIDLSEYKQLEITANVLSTVTGYSAVRVHLYSQKGKIQSNLVASGASDTTTGERTFLVDIGTVESAYITFVAGGTAAYRYEILEVRMVR